MRPFSQWNFQNRNWVIILALWCILHFFGNVRLLHYIPAKIIRVFVVMGSCTIASLKPTKVSWNKSFLYVRWLQRKLYVISCAENELILTLKEINEPQFDFHFANDRNRIFRIRQVLLSTSVKITRIFFNDWYWFSSFQFD